MLDAESIKEIEAQKAKEAIMEFIKHIPESNRKLAIQRASEKREQFLENLWREERQKLPPDLVAKHNLSEGLDGWKRYLKLGHKRENDFRKRFGFEDWSVKYQAQMLNTLEGDAYRVEHESEPRFKGSFFDHYFGGAGVDPEIWQGEVESIDPKSLLVHSINKEALGKAVTSGVVGRGGRAEVAMCQDRVVYDRGYIVVFQANELKAAGYPLIQINEDPRDAKILKEWRSPIPVDIRLARVIAPTTEISDREKASKAQIATSHFGEDYLRKIPRF